MYKKMLGRIETRTRDRIYCQTIRTVRSISRDDRARIATCSLRTPTEIRRIIVEIRMDFMCSSFQSFNLISLSVGYLIFITNDNNKVHFCIYLHSFLA